MNFRRADGEFDYGGFAAMTGLGIAVLVGYSTLIIDPLRINIQENKVDIRTNTEVARGVELTVSKVDVLMTKQNETLGNLAMTIDKLADKIDRTQNRGN